MAETRAAQASPKILIVDDQLSMAETLADGLSEQGFEAIALASSKEAAKRLENEHFDALVTDLRMPQIDGLELLKISRRHAPGRPVIVMTAYSAVESAIESIRQGAFHYLTKPFKLDELVLFLNRALEDSRLRHETAVLRSALRERFGLSNVVGQSEAMRALGELVLRIAQASSPVLLTGETGTGKGLIARAIHAHGPRASGPFVAVNCAALPENLLESELFGHVKGAFTGAASNRTGLFADADGGILFLDEIGEISAALQAKLLRVLESGSVRPVGANKEQTIDVRVVAATHRDLHERVASGAFREDLLYRLDVVSIEIPPLRHRQEDIPVLLAYFLERARAKHPESPVRGFSKAALERLLDHRWPGNVRELEHLVERVVLLGRGTEVEVEELPRSIGRASTAPLAFSGEIVPLREMQRRYAAWVFEALGGRRMVTAEKLDVDIKTLARLLKSETEPNDD
ncbi:MAG TPA: sigma-54 dependent transcriptional regulator [Polyangiaceae bacterium]|jgi:two-component system response regulator HydG|nr:sigma-54 dependent transcriptional regulator [Polyangiaceae bacterium]